MIPLIKRLLHKKIPLIIALIGGIVGLLYWKFVGCPSGSCSITAKWHTSTAYGVLLGWLLGDTFHKKSKPRKNKDDN